MPDVSRAYKMILAARTNLVLHQPFFGVLALRLRLVEDPDCPTAWTDGTYLGFNPTWIESLDKDHVLAVVAHEVMHCASGHPWRRGGRRLLKWNIACDSAINPFLRAAHFRLPSGVIYDLDPSHAGKSAEWRYDRMPDPPLTPSKTQTSLGEVRDPGGHQGSGSGKPESTQTAPQHAGQPYTEADWQQATQQAANIAKGQGRLPASLERFATGAVQPRVDWRPALWRFAQERNRNDYSWMRPNHRFLPQGLYLPAAMSEDMGPIAAAVDTSGSIDNITLRQFWSEMTAIVAAVRPRIFYVLYCDAKLQRVDTFHLGEDITLNPRGGGGTDFRPVFNALHTLEEPPVCLVYLTDLCGTFPTSSPDIPVLWAATTDMPVPFGEVVRLDTHYT